MILFVVTDNVVILGPIHHPCMCMNSRSTPRMHSQNTGTCFSTLILNAGNRHAAERRSRVPAPQFRRLFVCAVPISRPYAQSRGLCTTSLDWSLSVTPWRHSSAGWARWSGSALAAAQRRRRRGGAPHLSGGRHGGARHPPGSVRGTGCSPPGRSQPASSVWTSRSRHVATARRLAGPPSLAPRSRTHCSGRPPAQSIGAPASRDRSPS